jgi:putative transcriptional regulator
VLFVLSHLAFCSECVRRVRMLEALGGTLIEGAGETRLARVTAESVLDELERRASCAWTPKLSAAIGPIVDVLPLPLAPYVAVRAAGWRRSQPGVERLELEPGRLELVRVETETHGPEHEHAAGDFTLVLEGEIADDALRRRRCDVLSCDAGTRHAPATARGTICLRLTERTD